MRVLTNLAKVVFGGLMALVVAGASTANAQTSDLIFCSRFESPDCAPALDLLRPMVYDTEPMGSIVRPGQIPTLGATIVDLGTGVDPQSIRLKYDGQDVSSQATFVGDKLRFALKNAPVGGRHYLELEVRDRAGNLERFSWGFVVTTQPQITSVGPTAPELSALDAVVTASFTGGLEDIAVDGISLLVNEVDVTEFATITMTSAKTGSIRYVLPTPVEPGPYVAGINVPNQLGSSKSKAWDFYVLPAPIYEINVTTPSGSVSTALPEIEVKANIRSNVSFVDRVLIGGKPAELEPAIGDAEPLFVARVPLRPGANAIAIVAGFENGQSRTQQVSVTYNAPPLVRISAPSDWQVFGPLNRNTNTPGGAVGLTGLVERPIVVTGTTDAPVVRVEVNQQLATLGVDGKSFTFNNLFLHEGTNLLTVAATDALGRVASASRTVYVDQTAPILSIEGPDDNTATSATSIDVRGVVNDAIEAGVNALEPVVVVTNLSNNQQVTAETSDRYFIATEVPLEVGSNELQVTATDGLGNVRQRVLRVSRILTGSDRLSIVAGNRQVAPVSSLLPQPLAVTFVDTLGNALANQPVRFDIVRGSGQLRLQSQTPIFSDGVSPARNLIVNTNANGEAKVWLLLGSQTGAAANVVRVSHPRSADTPLFTATGLIGAPKYIAIDGGGSAQYAQTDSEPLDPLTAIVVDANYNRVRAAEVVFEILGGDARFVAASALGGVVSANGKQISLQTDKNGLASVRPLLGTMPGNVEINARATQAPDANAALFQIALIKPGEGATQLAGVVMDHTGKPLPGVRMSISRTALIATSNSAGKFLFSDQVPPGKIDLFVDGRDVQTQPGQQYPALHFETTIVRGRTNQLPHAIYLPPINLAAAQAVGGANDVTLTIPGFEGFAMIVKAGSVTFPDGSHVGPLVVSPVLNDRLPMVPPGGGAAFGSVPWTIQPTGTRFDPPIEVRLPNPGGMKAGQTVSLVQWDHDLALFVPIGRGTVNEDASLIVSDAGSGVSKAGWGGCGPPNCPPDPPDCATKNAGPDQPILANLRTYDVKRGWARLWLYKFPIQVNNDRISVQYLTEFQKEVSDSVCKERFYVWDDLGEGRGGPSGDKTWTQFQTTGEKTVRWKVACEFTKCNGNWGSKFWRFTTPIKVIDSQWEEYKAEMAACEWDGVCWAKVLAQNALGQIGETLGQVNVPWLQDLKQDAREWITRAGSAGGLSEGEVAAFATLYAITEVLAPEGALDIPVGYGIQAIAKVKKVYNISANEVGLMAKACRCMEDAVTRTTEVSTALPGRNRLCELAAKLPYFKWFKFEATLATRLPRTIRLLRGEPLVFLKPVRNFLFGFDGMSVYRKADGTIGVMIGESKHWGSTSKELKAGALTAFGLGARPGTLQQNIDVAIEFIDNSTLTDEVKDAAKAVLAAGEFDVMIHVLPVTKFDFPNIISTFASNPQLKKVTVYFDIDMDFS